MLFDDFLLLGDSCGLRQMAFGNEHDFLADLGGRDDRNEPEGGLVVEAGIGKKS
jgi:hypothetical protein